MNTSEHYIIRVKGSMGSSCRAHFEGLDLEQDADGNTFLCGRLDQAGLHGVLMRIRDLGLKLLEVRLLRNGSSPSARSRSI